MSWETILLIEDNPCITINNRELLELEGYRVLDADTLSKGRELVEKENPDLIILDILLPDGNGLEYCRELRGGNSVSILFLSALNTKDDAIEGLLAGGDGFIAKPYMNRELLAYVETLLRRNKMNRMNDSPLCFGAVELIFTPRRAYLNGEILPLKPMEFSALEYLARHMDIYVSAEELYEKVWGMDLLDDAHTVHNHVYGLRQKLGEDSRVIIDQKRGLGYCLSVTG